MVLQLSSLSNRQRISVRLASTAAVLLATCLFADQSASQTPTGSASKARSEKYLKACLNGGQYLDPDTGYRFECDESQLDAEQLQNLRARREMTRPGGLERNLQACKRLAQPPSKLGAPDLDQWERDLKRAQEEGRVGSCRWSFLTPAEAQAILQESRALLSAAQEQEAAARKARTAQDAAEQRRLSAVEPAMAPPDTERGHTRIGKLDPTRRAGIADGEKQSEKSLRCKVTYRPALLAFTGTKTYSPQGSVSLRRNVYFFQDSSGSPVSLPAERTTVEGCGIVAPAPPPPAP